MKASDAKRLKEREIENTWRMKLLPEADFDKAMLKELAEDAPIAQVRRERAT
jgi:hypothetical protein